MRQPLYRLKLVLISLISCGRSVAIVRSQSQAMGFFFSSSDVILYSVTYILMSICFAVKVIQELNNYQEIFFFATYEFTVSSLSSYAAIIGLQFCFWFCHNELTSISTTLNMFKLAWIY
jgi:hypothetical protein